MSGRNVYEMTYFYIEVLEWDVNLNAINQSNTLANLQMGLCTCKLNRRLVVLLFFTVGL